VCVCVCVCVCVLVVVVVLGTTQDLTLANQALYHLSHSTSPVITLGIFEIGSLELFVHPGLKLRSS
jgi:hypothetical protein